VSTIRLRFLNLNDRRDWPVVQILVDDREAFVDHLPRWQGFDPADILGDQSPLLPQGGAGRRVAVYRCSCGIAGCGVVAPVILASSDDGSVSWVDFRNYVGVFTGPIATDVDRHEGRPWPFQDLHFDYRQYIAEVRRASSDHSWETLRWATARLVTDGLRLRRVMLTPTLRLGRVTPAWDDGDDVRISFQNEASDEPFVEQILSLTSRHNDSEHASRDILEQLAAVPIADWTSRFGWQPPHD
jgi:hypothetical protein